MKQACRSCGALLAPDAERCDLCGTPVPVDAEDGSPSDSPPSPYGPLPAAADAGKAYCIACGHANVPEARFCNRCGAPLPSREGPAPPADTAPPTTKPVAAPAVVSTDRPSSEPGRRALWLVGFGLVAVLVIYAATTLGRRDRQPTVEGPASPEGTASSTEMPTPTIDPGAVADLALPEALRADADAAAMLVEGARSANTAEAWDDAGRIYLDLTRRATPDLRPVLARQAVAAFSRSLEIEESPDVRTRMVSAYRYDPAATMQPVLELQRVLNDSPNHPEANFQMGELRLQINRLDSAVASFDRAAAHAPDGSVLQRDARMMAERARQAAAEPAASPAAGGG